MKPPKIIALNLMLLYQIAKKIAIQNISNVEIDILFNMRQEDLCSRKILVQAHFYEIQHILRASDFPEDGIPLSRAVQDGRRLSLPLRTYALSDDTFPHIFLSLRYACPAF